MLTYVQADKWDESLADEERVRINVLWDGCWNGGTGCQGDRIRRADNDRTL